MKQPSSTSPNAIIMVGLPGAGKSAFAEHFAETFEAPIVNAGALQQELRLDDAQADWLQVIMLNEFFKTRRTVLIDGRLESKTRRAEMVKYVTKAGYRPLLVWVQTDPVESRRRATKKYPVGSGLTAHEFQAALKAFEPPLAKERPIVISGKHTFTTQLKVVLKQISAMSDRPKANTQAQAAYSQVAHPRPQTPPTKPRGISIR